MMCCGRSTSFSKDSMLLGPTSVPLRNFWSGLHQDCVASLIFLFPPLLKLMWQVLVLPFTDGCRFNHLVQFQFPLHTFFTACVPRIRFLFHNGHHCVNLSRDLFQLALRLCTSPIIMRTLSTFFPGKWPPSGFCLAVPLFVLPSFSLFQSWQALRPHSSLSRSTASPT